jgi:hypothetical protein
MEIEAFTKALNRFGKSYEWRWYEGMGAQLCPNHPGCRGASRSEDGTNLSYTRSFEFLHRELDG